MVLYTTKLNNTFDAVKSTARFVSMTNLDPAVLTKEINISSSTGVQRPEEDPAKKTDRQTLTQSGRLEELPLSTPSRDPATRSSR